MQERGKKKSSIPMLDDEGPVPGTGLVGFNLLAPPLQSPIGSNAGAAPASIPMATLNTVGSLVRAPMPHRIKTLSESNNFPSFMTSNEILGELAEV